jgi:hypothetical protein
MMLAKNSRGARPLRGVPARALAGRSKKHALTPLPLADTAGMATNHTNLI